MVKGRIKRIFGILFAIMVMALTLSSCRTTEGTDHDQIVRTSIDLAQAYVDKGEYRSALEVYDKALLQADDYRLYYNKSIVLSYMGDYSGAAELCGNAFLSYPYILSFKTAQAEYLKAIDDGQSAIAVYLEMLELNPYDRAIRNDYIDLLMAYGDDEEAYRQAQILWNQGYKDKETVSYLYKLNPQAWENTYRQLNR
ncbi:MAG: tetratricopeptide repeat protein [Spirochaetales bacterium]|nr:tetratricopeptide repeat protein [Spirochaetales bacterium]